MRDPPRIEAGPRETRILLIEDDPDDADYVKELLAEEQIFSFHVEETGKLADGIDRLSKGGIDVVLLDLGLPDSMGLETIIKLRPYSRRLPVVIISGLDDAQIDVKAIQEGAQDFIVKGRMDRHTLTRTILHALRRMKMYETLRGEETEHKETSEGTRDLILNLLSHEIRRPLSIIKGTLDNLKDGVAGPLTQAQADYVKMAGQQASCMNDALGGLLDLSRIEFGSPKTAWTPFTPAGIMEELSAYIREKSGDRSITLERDIQPDLPKFYADIEMVGQVLTRLLSHLLDYSREKIVVQLGIVEDAFPTQTGTDGRAGIRFSIIGDELDVDPEETSALFAPFTGLRRPGVRGLQKGDRLGLAICKKIVEFHGGKMWAESLPGSGLTLHFLLPCLDEAAHFRARFSDSLRIADLHQNPLTLMALTIDNLEQIKFLSAEPEIERMYRSIEERVASVLRTVDAICRLKERIVILAQTGREESRTIRIRVLHRIREAYCTSRLGDRVGAICRIGMAVHGEDASVPEELFSIAASK